MAEVPASRPGQAQQAEHLLSPAGVLWNKVKDELKEKPEDSEKPYADAAPVPPEELRKVAKWFQHAVTKFGASAAVAEGPSDPAMKSVAEEVVKAFTAAQGTLLSMRREAGPSLCQELVDVGSGLAETTAQLGAAVGTANMAVCAGKALDRTKHLERISTQNRAATRRRLLTTLTLLRDANRELSEALNLDAKSRGAASDDDSDDLGDLDEELEPEERRVVEATVKVVHILEEILKKASAACRPSDPSSEGPSSAPPPSVEDLEVAAKHAALAAGAVDGLAAHALGGLDVVAFGKSLKELRDATTALAGPFPHTADGGIGLEAALEAVQAAVDDASNTAEPQDG